MANNNQMPKLSAAQLNLLLSLAGKQMGTTPEALCERLKNGQLPANVDPAQIAQLMNDPQKLNSMLQSPRAQQMLRTLLGQP